MIPPFVLTIEAKSAEQRMRNWENLRSIMTLSSVFEPCVGTQHDATAHRLDLFAPSRTCKGDLIGRPYWRNLGALIILALFLAACGNTSAEKQTLIAHDQNLGTSIANLHIDDNVREQRLLATLERAQTQVAQAGTQQGAMVLTLEARGLNVTLPAVATLAPPPRPSDSSSNSASVPNAPTVQVTPFTTTPDPSVFPLINVITAQGVDNNDCAVGVTNQFTPASERIYIVATARELADGTTVVSRWFQGDNQVAVFDHTFAYIEEACIWFYADQTDFEFTPGEYRIALEINGTPAAPAKVFTIVAG